MNQKKCPKCGENNPAEAVMCWACYTPLSGAPVASGPIPGSTPAPGEASEKKPIAAWQIGVIGLALLIAAGFGISTLVGGASTDVGMSDPIPTVEGPRTIAPINGGPTVTVEPPTAPQGGTVQQQASAAAVSAYTVTTQPSRKWSVATVGIMPSQATSDPRQAATLAATLGRKMRKGPWKTTHVYVFADQETATAFQQFQRNRDNAPLTAGDYPPLEQVWQGTIVRYESNGGSENIRYPQQNPRGWWGGSAAPPQRR